MAGSVEMGFPLAGGCRALTGEARNGTVGLDMMGGGGFWYINDEGLDNRGSEKEKRHRGIYREILPQKWDDYHIRAGNSRKNGPRCIPWSQEIWNRLYSLYGLLKNG